jgi:5'-3' exonuclease
MSRSFLQESNNLLIVDSQNIAFRWLGVSEWGHKLAGTISSLAVSYNAKKVIVLGDGRSKWRTTCLPSYKANRKEKREASSEEEQQKWEHFMQEYQKAIEIIKSQYTYLRFADAEADDIAAYICKYKSDLFSHTWLVSTDKDWDLLISPKVSRFSYIKQNEVTWDNWSEYYSITPEEYISMKVLMGDKGDNVPGVPGIGEKRAQSLIKEYGSAFDIHDSIPLPGKLKYIQALNESKELLLTNYMLMDLLTYCDDALEGHTDEINEVFENEIIDDPY